MDGWKKLRVMMNELKRINGMILKLKLKNVH